MSAKYILRPSAAIADSELVVEQLFIIIFTFFFA